MPIKDRLQAHRRARLLAAADKEGGKAALGRLLGFKDGAFIGQMIRGERPVTEETVLNLEGKSGYKGWFRTVLDFDLSRPLPPEVEKFEVPDGLVEQFFQNLTKQLAAEDEDARRVARALLDGIFEQPRPAEDYKKIMQLLWLEYQKPPPLNPLGPDTDEGIAKNESSESGGPPTVPASLSDGSVYRDSEKPATPNNKEEKKK